MISEEVMDDIGAQQDVTGPIATLREVALSIGWNATSEEELRVARDLVFLLRFLRTFDKGLH